MNKDNNYEVAYFDWLCYYIDDKYVRYEDYTKLLETLFDTDFIYNLPMDVNRYYDGIDLREKFFHENPAISIYKASLISQRKCSIFEVMVALAMRCEDDIMYDAEIGDRTSKWFWYMIRSLGLFDMTNDNFDKDRVIDILEKFSNNDYEPNGYGGLFYIPSTDKDLRKTEIWYQMCWFLNQFIWGRRYDNERA